nr:MAG TPA: hypothetical protein [Bacteriophage sp.]DAP31301.1 MAG TPA: hypothetical protein [Caudoviricetes sp.]
MLYTIYFLNDHSDFTIKNNKYESQQVVFNDCSQFCSQKSENNSLQDMKKP